RSYVPPILLVAATLVGYAARQRSSRYAFAAVLVLNLASTGGYLLAGLTGGLTYDAELWTHLALLNSIVASASALFWVGSVTAWWRWNCEEAPPPGDRLLTVVLDLGVALALLVLIAGTAALFVHPLPDVWHDVIAGPWGWTAFLLAAGAVGAWGWTSGRSMG